MNWRRCDRIYRWYRRECWLWIRGKVLSYLGYLGIKMDEKMNEKRGENFVLSTADSAVKVAVIPTNEELAICRETVELVK